MKRIGAFCAVLLVAAAAAGAAELRVIEDQSVFAIVTHKGGFASGKAHNHFVSAAGYTVRLEGEEGTVEGAVFEIELAVENLVFDSPELQKAFYPRLEALGILDEPFGEPSEKDREKIRESGIGDKQLDAERFPEIKARLVGIAEEPSTLGEVELPYRVTLELELHGETARRPLAASLAWEDGTLRAEAAGTFLFSDFGIKPYSAFFGAVKNLDEFHVYVKLTAAP